MSATLIEDLSVLGTIPRHHIVQCVFAMPPGVLAVDGTDADALVELGIGGYFMDTSREYRLSVVVRDVKARNKYALNRRPVEDGYWAITGFDLPPGVPYLIPGTVGEAAAPFFRIAPFPHEEGKGHDSRRCYYLKNGVPSIVRGTVPMTFGAPYAKQDTYIELTSVQKVVTVYGAEGQCESGAVGTWAYDVGHGLRRFLDVAVSAVFHPRAGNYEPVAPRIYRITGAGKLTNTYWAPVPPPHMPSYNGTFFQLA